MEESLNKRVSDAIKKMIEPYRDYDIIKNNELSLNKWLDLMYGINDKKVLFTNYCFPSDMIKKEYLDSINQRTDEEVIDILRNFLIQSGSLGSDEWKIEFLLDYMKNDWEHFKRLMKLEFNKRLLRSIVDENVTVWEGNSWIIDLLPHEPKIALDALHAYWMAHIQLLSDGRFDGLLDSMSLIRAKFIETPKSDFLFNIDPYEFEYLIDSLYMEMGYRTIMTKRSYDKGRDIICEKSDVGKREKILVQCKTSIKNIGVKEVRALLGVVSNEKATKGVMATNSNFTHEARKFQKENSRIELIGNSDLQVLLNTYFGSEWYRRVDHYITRSMKKESERIEKG